MFIVICPHCKESVIIEELNCGIFRHGVKKKNGKQLNPHLSREKCEEYVQNNWIYGCGKPFQVVKSGEEMQAVVCDYI